MTSNNNDSKFNLLYQNGAKPAWIQELQRPEFVCGWGAAFVNICVTFPINKVMFRQQLDGVRMYKAVHDLKKEGIRNIYRGLVPPLLQKTTSMSLMFGLYHEFSRDINDYFPDLWAPVNKSTAAMLNKSTAAMLAGTVESILTPFERLQVLMQTNKYHKRYSNTYHAFTELKREYGIREFYRGQTAVLLRNGPSNVFFFLGRDYLLSIYPEDGSPSQKICLDFISGALLGAFISTLFYPMNVLKVRMQSKVGGDYCRLVQTFKIIMKERNNSVTKLFRGLHVNYTRAFLSWGIANATYEFLMKTYFAEYKKDPSGYS